MSLIVEYRTAEAALEELKARLESLQGDTRLQKELEFEEKLRELMGEYNKSLRDIIAILDPDRLRQPSQQKQVRAPRKLKRYENPHTGELFETKGGNSSKLKQWKAEYGSEAVDSWVVSS